MEPPSLWDRNSAHNDGQISGGGRGSPPYQVPCYLASFAFLLLQAKREGAGDSCVAFTSA